MWLLHTHFFFIKIILIGFIHILWFLFLFFYLGIIFWFLFKKVVASSNHLFNILKCLRMVEIRLKIFCLIILIVFFHLIFYKSYNQNIWFIDIFLIRNKFFQFQIFNGWYFIDWDVFIMYLNFFIFLKNFNFFTFNLYIKNQCFKFPLIYFFH